MTLDLKNKGPKNVPAVEEQKSNEAERQAQESSAHAIWAYKLLTDLNRSSEYSVGVDGSVSISEVEGDGIRISTKTIDGRTMLLRCLSQIMHAREEQERIAALRQQEQMRQLGMKEGTVKQ